MVVGFLFQLISLVQTCAPEVAPETMLAIVEVSSKGDPLSISVVGAKVKTPPTTVEEAVTLAIQLASLKKTFSVGLAQLPKKNLSKLGLSYELAFDPCTNLTAASKVLSDCYINELRRLGGLLKLVHQESQGAYSKQTAEVLQLIQKRLQGVGA